MQSSTRDPYGLERYRAYLRLLAEQNVGHPFRTKLDLSGIVQESLWEAHQELTRGTIVPANQLRAWLQRILAHNLTDQIRRLSAGKRDVLREVSLHQVIQQSSHRLELWLSREIAPQANLENEEQFQRLAEALFRLPDAQRKAILLHHWHGRRLADVAAELGSTREAAAGLIKRGLKQLRATLQDNAP